MAELPFPWSVYAEHQSKAARSGRIGDKSWGIENGLTNFLTALESGSDPASPDDFRGSVTAAEWGLLIAVAAGLAAHEVAAARGVTAGSVRTRVARLRARLRPIACPLPRPDVQP